jgi:hypothetical protein
MLGFSQMPVAQRLVSLTHDGIFIAGSAVTAASIIVGEGAEVMEARSGASMESRAK